MDGPNNNTDRDDCEADPVELLLPWYETGKLTADEHKRVEEALACDAGLRAQLSDIKRDREAVGLAYGTLPMPSGQAWEVLSERIERFETEDAKSGTLLDRKSNLFGRVGELVGSWFDRLTPERLGLVAIAAVFFVAAQAVTIAIYVFDTDTEYVTASGSSGYEGRSEGFAIVSFVPEITLGEIDVFLEANNLQIVDGPIDGFYTLAMNDDTISPDQVDAYISKLTDSTEIVAFIGRKSD